MEFLCEHGLEGVQHSLEVVVQYVSVPLWGKEIRKITGISDDDLDGLISALSADWLNAEN
jgi:hypothetical protein